MNFRIPSATTRTTVILSLATAAVVASTGLLRAESTGDAALDANLAERFALIADDSANAQSAPEPFLREAAALLDMARELSPKEIRFARSSANVLLRLGESDRALAALSVVRALDPKDQLAMIQYIDLSANAMESADARAAYLQQVVDAKSISAEVRSHAALNLMELLYQRAEDDHAAELLETALALNPQNVAALTMKYRTAVSSSGGIARAQALSALLQASPVDVNWLVQGMRECMAAGDFDGAHGFFELLLSVRISHGENPSIDELINIAGSELLSGTAADAGPLIKQSLAVLKDDGRLYAIDLLIAQFNGTKSEDLAPTIAAARGVYLAQLAGVSQLLNKPDQKEMPATNPAVPLPDVAADVAKLVAADPAGLRSAYTVALAEQLWFDIYFRAAAVDDASIAALATLLGSDADPLVVRLQGWKLLSAGQIAEAKVKLSAVADRDAYAKLGLAAAAVAESKADDAKRMLGELVATRPEGMLSVYIGVAAKIAEVKSVQNAAEQQVAKILSPLRKPITDLLKNPRSAYLLTAAPVNVSFGPGEPLLARVTLQNNGRVPITIGPGGLVDSDFQIDLQTRGEAPRGFASVGSGKWWGAVRLLPQQAITQVVRLDRGAANGFFRQYPTPLMTVSASITTNALTAQNTTYPVAGGQQATIGNVMERRSSPLYVDAFRAKVIDRIANGSPLERLNAMELTATVLPALEKQADNDDAKKAALELRQALDGQIEKEPVPEVKAWAMIGRAIATAGDQGSNDLAAVATMQSTGARVAALLVARALPSMPQRQALADAILAKSPEGPIAELARGIREQPNPPASTQPTTDPATAAQP